MILYIIRGVPGTGKGKLGKLLAPDHSYSASDFFLDKQGSSNYDPTRLESVHSKCFKAVRADMFSGVEAVAVCNTFVHSWEFSDYVDLAIKLGYTVREIICRGDSISQFAIPSEKIQKMLDEFEY